jgi:hypothetical protein
LLSPNSIIEYSNRSGYRGIRAVPAKNPINTSPMHIIVRLGSTPRNLEGPIIRNDPAIQTRAIEIINLFSNYLER